MKNQIILTETNFSRLKEFVKKNKEKEIVFTSTDDNLNRKVCEKLPIDILLIPLENRKDFMKQRDSGMNEILMRIMKKNKIKLGIDFDEILKSKNKERIFSRLKQNIFLVKKGKISLALVGNKQNKDISGIKALLSLLGCHNSLLKNL